MCAPQRWMLTLTNVILLAQFPPEYIVKMESVPGVTLQDLSPLMRRISGKRGQEDAELIADRQELATKLAEAEVICAMNPPVKNFRESSPKLKWLQSTWAGVDGFIGSGVIEDKVMTTTGSGAGARPIAEWVMAAILSQSRNLPDHQRQQEKKEWKRLPADNLEDKQMVLLGTGAIGSMIAKFASAFGMKITGVRRSPDGSIPDGMQAVHAQSEFASLVPKADWVVLAAPLTNETKGILGAAELKSMKPTARVVNVGRGQLIDEAALIEALQHGTIAGAALDVFEVEPLPTDSPLWTMENVIVSPHIASSQTNHWSHVAEIFLDNLERYVAGKPMRNVYDESRGY